MLSRIRRKNTLNSRSAFCTQLAICSLHFVPSLHFVLTDFRTQSEMSAVYWLLRAVCTIIRLEISE